MRKLKILKPSYFLKALHDRKIEELSLEYSSKGFSVEKNVRLQGVEFDLVARRKNKTIAFEVKLLPVQKSAMESIEKLRSVATKMNFDFRLIVISRPEEKVISINWIDSAFQKYFEKHEMSQLHFLPEPFKIERIHCDITSLNIIEGIAKAKINGSIDVEIVFEDVDEDGNQNGIEASDTIPFKGEIEIDLAKRIIISGKIDVNSVHWICKH